MPGCDSLAVRCLVPPLLMLVLMASEAPALTTLEIDAPPHGVVRWDRGDTPALLVKPSRGDGWYSLAKRLTGSSSAAAALKRANPGLENPLRDRAVRVPLHELRADLRLEMVTRLFPIDRRVEPGYQHWVLDPFDDKTESWEWLAKLFCGREDRAGDLLRANAELGEHGLQRGRPVLIPGGLLLPVFRSLESDGDPDPVPSRPDPVQELSPQDAEGVTPLAINGSSGALDFGVDSGGEFAVYRLRRGEALYSAVVVRFTGQLLAAQVNETAREIAVRSGIDDVTDIPVDYPIKIPLDLVLPEFLPEHHPKRIAWEREQKELAGFLEVVHATDLSGVHVILDAGHGGRDTGAVVDGVWESSYAYDIMCRVKESLTRYTKAVIWTTVRDTSRGYDVPGRDRLRQDRDQVLLTHPTHSLDDSVTGVHLRWYLVNDIILDRIPKDVPRSKVVFVSIHADSLHPSVRGSMVYVPSRHLRPKSYRAKSNGISEHSEYREHPTVKLSSSFVSRSEASSRYLAARIVESLRRNEIPVHANKPVRDRVRRGRQTYVPAVLRYSLAQHAVLVECVNMANAEDRRNLLDQEWRQRFARSLVEGIASAFNGR